MIIIYIIFAVILVLRLKVNRYEIINDTFWLISSWSLIIITYLFSGYRPTGKVDFLTWIYISACIGGFLIFEKLGMKGVSNKAILDISNKERLSIKEIRISDFYFWLGVLGTAIYVLDLYLQNGALAIGLKTSLEISIIGAIANLFYPITFVYYINGLTNSIFLSKRINAKIIVSGFAYVLPCVAQSGRENIILIVISTLAIFLYGFKYKKLFYETIIAKGKRRKQLFLLVLGGVVFISVFMFVSKTRYSENEANMFFYYNSSYLPEKFRDEVNKLGAFKNVYLNMFQYYCAQIPMLDLLVRHYDGPYIFGLYNLNMISRRLPSSWGLNYIDCSRQFQSIYLNYGTRFFIGGWPTVLGSLIPDFTVYGTVIVSCIFGYLIGKSKRKLLYDWNSMRLGLQAIMCMELYYTIQIGPFFQFPVWGIVLWWFIIYKINIRTIRIC